MGAVLPSRTDDWQQRAACRGLPVPEDQIPPAICDGCPVRLECLAVALEHKMPHGRWGGLDPLERAELLAGTGGHVGEAILRSAREHAETDAHARRAAMVRHPSAGGDRQLELGFPPPDQLRLGF